MKTAARSLLRRLGVDVVRYAPRNFLHLRRPLLLAEEGIDLVLDVGASDGGWARTLRRAGYAGLIVSFEPLSSSFAALERAASRDSAWSVRKIALADRDGTARLHVAANEQSSSLLPMLATHLRHAPEAPIIGDEDVEVARLDALGLVRPRDRVYVKLDVQGAELDVLRGGVEALRAVRLLEAELSAVPLYDGQPLLEDVIEHLRSMGFDLIGLEPAFRDRETGQLLQANGLFRRR